MKKVTRLCKLAALCFGLLTGACSDASKQEAPAVYPLPHQMESSGQWIKMAEGGYRLEGMQQFDEDAVNVMKQFLTISEQATQAITVHSLEHPDEAMQRSGAYTLKVTAEGIDMGINDGRSFFYAAQTLSQLADAEGRLWACSVTDYPDIAIRGVVEGFYGEPWSFEKRVEQLRFYGRMKMNTYIFGPKDDPYHRSPYWRVPYPEDQAQHIRSLLEEAERNKVDFVWALHPGMDIRWGTEDRLAALKKLESMYDLGVRAFAVFFDDIEGDGTDARQQAAFMNYLKQELVDKKGDVRQLILCPTEYNRDWAKTDYLDILGESLDPDIHVMWTGDKVVSDITREGLEWVNRRIRRPCYLWWNFPVSDFTLAHLLMGPVSGLEKESAAHMYAFVSNPMEYAEASKVALWGVAQFTWNVERFDSEQSWQEACNHLVPEAPEAFRLFCEHNADIGPNTWMFFREESFHSSALIRRFQEAMLAGNYQPEDAKALTALFEHIQEAPALIRERASNRGLLDEIDPWLTQTANVGAVGKCVMRMLEAAAAKDGEACRKAYDEAQQALQTIYAFNRLYRRGEQDGIRSGEQVLMPFVRRMMQYVEDTLLTDLRPHELPEVLAGSVGADELACYAEDDVVGLVPHFPLLTLKPGDYFGFRLEADKEPLALVYDLRKSKAQGRVFQVSADGATWTDLPEAGANRVDTLTLTQPQARYVRCLNRSQADMTIGIGRFHVLTKAINQK